MATMHTPPIDLYDEDERRSSTSATIARWASAVPGRRTATVDEADVAAGQRQARTPSWAGSSDVGQAVGAR